ncbi:MAG: hypothetical protein B7Y54_08735 [Polaromonas sp. 35-63-240]|uniref:WD40/YVTN/BNR-like repeat-containing protein n=1 Tax=Polaromonas sp. TaxID=1869339 RepID=UPI000BD1A6EC|nr:sialidase family protein [Polaromonas sp.]OYY51916.1 MAG: hypothetical protein B7Y54_08735 [Polaromonas sp. 35-63-240]HQS31903.1 sialidase family protein [Polaromonas sp.]HQS92763.1 sialidase family protein [Polaromonas sp.]
MTLSEAHSYTWAIAQFFYPYFGHQAWGVLRNDSGGKKQMTTTQCGASARLLASLVLAAALAACGGGGGGGGTTVSADAGGNQPAPVTPVAPVNPVTPVTPAAPFVLKLPVEPDIKINDTITVRGASTNGWSIVQNAGQTIGTRALPGSVEPGLAFTAAAKSTHNWWFAASSASGQKLAAVGNNFQALHAPNATASGTVWTSADGGVNWAELNALGQPPSNAWASIASSADGTKLAVVGIAAGIWTSADSGATWTSNDLPQYFPDISKTEFVSVSMSADGSRMVAATLYTDGGTGVDGRIFTYEQTPGMPFGQGTWTQQASPTSIHMWRGVAMSADGSTLVAAAYQDSQAANEGVYVSTDHGATWTNKLSPAATTAYRVAISADGKTMIMAERFGKIYTSSDAGVSWTLGASSGGFNAVASSADGKTLMAVQANGFAAVEGPNPPADRNGKLLVSSDGGANWISRGPTGEWWRGAAMSADGNRLVAARDAGPIYVSTGNRTTYGTAGSITGAPANDITLRYLGDGLFDATSATGPTFTIN